MASRNIVALLLCLCVIAALAKIRDNHPTAAANLASEPRQTTGPLSDESAIFAAVVDDYAKNLQPPIQPGEVVMVSNDGFSPQAELVDSYSRQNLMKACEEIGVNPAVLDVLARNNSQTQQWDLDSWPTSVPLKDDKEFWRHFEGIESIREAKRKGGPGRQVFEFCRPAFDESTGDIVVYARKLALPPPHGVLYRLSPGFQVIGVSRPIGLY